MTIRKGSKFNATVQYLGVQNSTGYNLISLSPEKCSYEKFWT